MRIVRNGKSLWKLNSQLCPPPTHGWPRSLFYGIASQALGTLFTAHNSLYAWNCTSIRPLYVCGREFPFCHHLLFIEQLRILGVFDFNFIFANNLTVIQRTLMVCSCFTGTCGNGGRMDGREIRSARRPLYKSSMNEMIIEHVRASSIVPPHRHHLSNIWSVSWAWCSFLPFHLPSISRGIFCCCW